MYGKLFASTFSGSMMAAGPEVFAVWAYVIAHAKDSGVELNPKLLAAVVGSTEERMIKAIEALCAADPNSRSPDMDGRRLVREGQFQYRVVNHLKYRTIRNEDDRRAYNRDAKRRERKRQTDKSREKSLTVDDSRRQSIVSAHTEAEAEALSSPPPPSEKKSRGKPPTTPAAAPLPDWVPSGPWADFVAHRKAMRGVPFTDAARAGVLRELFALSEAGHDPAKLLETAVTRGWRTVFAPHAGSPNGRAAVSTAERDAEARRLLFGSKGDVIDA